MDEAHCQEKQTVNAVSMASQFNKKTVIAALIMMQHAEGARDEQDPMRWTPWTVETKEQ